MAIRATVLLALLLAGCGSQSVHQLPPAAEPRASPPLTARPAGRVVRVGPTIGRLTAGRTQEPGGAPEGLAFDPASGTLGVGLRRPAELALLDGTTGQVRKRVALPAGPRHLAAARGVFYVPAEMADRLVAVRAGDGRVLRDTPVGRRPHGVAVAGDAVAVGDEDGNAVEFVRAGRVAARLGVATQPGAVASVGDGRIAVVSVRERVVELYDAHRRLARLPAGVGPTHAAALGNWLWVVDTQGDGLLVYRLRPSLRLERRVRLAPGPYGIAVDPVRCRLWVTLTGSNRVDELPAHGRPHVLASFPTVRQPNDVAVDSRTGRVFVGGRADGVVQLLDPPGAPQANPVGHC